MTDYLSGIVEQVNSIRELCSIIDYLKKKEEMGNNPALNTPIAAADDVQVQAVAADLENPWYPNDPKELINVMQIKEIVYKSTDDTKQRKIG